MAAFMCHYTAYVDDEEVEGPEQVNSLDEHEGKIHMQDNYDCSSFEINVFSELNFHPTHTIW